MQFDKTGFILYVIRYAECVDFYKNTIGLKILFQGEQLTCFEFGGSYLMVEFDDETTETVAVPPKRDRSCLRMNVENVRVHADRLEQSGIEVNYMERDWGTVAKFRDPDGNLIAYKDMQKFNAQIADHAAQGHGT